jgi:hypothetical protein
MSPRKSIAPPVNALSDIAMLATLNINVWAATVTDQKISKEVAKAHNASEDSGVYRKNAIDIRAPEWRAVISAKSNLRNRYYELTLPWGNNGSRILSAMMHPKFCDDMRKLMSEFRSAVAAFVAAFPRLQSEAQVKRNGMYNQNDYPENISAKFDCGYSFDQVANADDFRIKLASSVVEEIREDLRKQSEQVLNDAMKDAYNRLYKHINRMVDRLADRKPPKGTKGKAKRAKAKEKGGKFRETLITGLEELCELLPMMNLNGDEQLIELTDRARAMIKGLTVEQLREAPTVRRNVLVEAKKIQDIMSTFMGPPVVDDEE